ncbi:hypothetical protein [Nocardioides sp. SYSU DS0651]|uniref:hypothetical protein n=1 Tax=Nocardioides sp. SYSU DS0651 TaxID=3415955 RepID=UPI003F4C1BD7
MAGSGARGGAFRRTTCAALAALPALVLAACGGEDVGAKPDLPTEPPARWNPCDALDSAFVEKNFGSVAEERNGTPTKPDCRFAPEEESGEPVVTANYILFPGKLEDAWESMGQSPDADVREPRIDGADAARIVVAVEQDQLYVTGFVQNGDLIQQVDVADPAPFAKAQVVAGVRTTLARLSDHANAAGVGKADPSAE